MIAITAIPDSAVRRELATVLEAAGWTVRHALNGDDVLEGCRALEPDVVLVDAAFPGGAVALLDRVKADPKLFRTAVVVVVADGLAVADVVAAMDRGADDVLRRPLDPADALARAVAAARTKALVSELTEQHDHLEGLVLFDELTGVRNRRAVLSDLEQMLAAARRHGHALAVVMIDVDRFKAINDEHGHAAGDDVLRAVATRIGTRLRAADVLGRLGGDELLLLLADTDATGAAVLAAAVRAEVADRPVPTTVGPVPVTVSLGSAAWDGESAGELIDRADRALLAAKHAGRDQAAAAR